MNALRSVLSVLLINNNLTYLLPGLFCLKIVGYLLAHFPKLAVLNLTKLGHLVSSKAVSLVILLSDGIPKEILVMLVFSCEISPNQSDSFVHCKHILVKR